MTPDLSENVRRHLATFPGPLELRAPPVKPFAVAIFAMLLLWLLGFAFYRFGQQMLAAPLVVSIVYFAVCVAWLVFAVTAVWFASDIPRGRAALTLDADGFKASLFFRRVRRSWARASDFTYRPSSWGFGKITYLDRSGSSGPIERSLPGVGFHYGMESADLAALMNAWRALAAARGQPRAAQ